MKRFICRRRYVTYPGEFREIMRLILRGTTKPARKVAQFEQALAGYHGVPHVRLVSSGRFALLTVLQAAGLQAGDEILVPAYTLRALILLLEEAGYVPVPVDILETTFNLDPACAARQTGPKTKAILALHLFGRPCDMAALRKLCDTHRLLLLEDCAHALGSTIDGQHVGSLGDAAFLSFDLLKPINTFGGGAILTRRADIGAQVDRLLASLPQPGYGILGKLAMGSLEHYALTTPILSRTIAWALNQPVTSHLVSLAYRSLQNTVRVRGTAFTDLQAHIGLRKLGSIDARTAIRRAMARRLSCAIGKDASKIDAGENGYFFVRLTKDPVRLRRDLLESGIDAGSGSEVADYCGDLGRGSDCPVARKVFEQAIQLPLHEGLTDADIDRIGLLCQSGLQTTIEPAGSHRS